MYLQLSMAYTLVNRASTQLEIGCSGQYEGELIKLEKDKGFLEDAKPEQNLEG